jgi:hypothetical protein
VERTASGAFSFPVRAQSPPPGGVFPDHQGNNREKPDSRTLRIAGCAVARPLHQRRRDPSLHHVKTQHEEKMEKETATHQDAYEVGRSKPPKAGQFKPGQGGNPKGRPKGASLRDIVQRIANETVDREWARLRDLDPSLTRLEGVVARLFQNAQLGDVAAIKQVLELARRTEAPAADEDVGTEEGGGSGEAT